MQTFWESKIRLTPIVLHWFFLLTKACNIMKPFDAKSLLIPKCVVVSFGSQS